jgi:hypothetical protein
MSDPSDLVIPSELSSTAALIIADLVARFNSEPRATLTRAESCQLGGWKLSTQLNKERSGALLSILDGSARRVLTRSLFQHLITLTIISHPLGKPAARVRSRQTRTGFRRKVSARTEAQLEALRTENDRRANAAGAKKRGLGREARDLEPA